MTLQYKKLDAMIDSAITEYMSANKRLVIPDFGAFIKKDEGEVVFVEFLKKDDGVLSSLLRKSYSFDETEAAAVIREYVANIKKTVASTGRYLIDGIGYMRSGSNGLYELEYSPAQAGYDIGSENIIDKTSDSFVPHFTAMPAAEDKPVPADTVVDGNRHAAAGERMGGERMGGSGAYDLHTHADGRTDTAVSAAASAAFPKTPVPPPSPSVSPASPQEAAEKRMATINELYGSRYAGTPAGNGGNETGNSGAYGKPAGKIITVKAPDTDAEESTAPVSRREPCRAGGTASGSLASGDGGQGMDAGRTENRTSATGQTAWQRPQNGMQGAEGAIQGGTQSAPQQPQPQKQNPAHSPQVRKNSAALVDYRSRRKRTDTIMVIAVIAAIIAIASMIYGMFVNNSPLSSIKPTKPQENTELVSPEAGNAAETGTK